MTCKEGEKHYCSSGELTDACTETCRNAVRYSTAQAFNRCRRYYMHRYVDFTRPAYPGEETSLNIGTAVHAGLELYFSHSSVSKQLAAALSSVELPEDAQRAVDAMLTGYAAVYGRHTWAQWRTGLTVLAQVTPTLALVASPDAVVTLDTGEVALIEHKTTSSSDLDRWWIYKDTDPQTLLYAAALRHEGVKISKICYDVLRVPAFKRKDPDELIAKNPSGYYKRIWRSVSSAELDAVVRDYSTVKSLQEHCAVLDRYDRNGASCQAFGRQCEYFETCWGGRDKVTNG